MALATYADLLASIASWMKPNTALLPHEHALIPDYVRLLEAKLNRTLVHPRMFANATLTFTNGAAAVPATCLQVQKIQLTQSPWTELVPIDADIPAALSGFSTGSPTGYKWDGSNFILDTYASVTAAIRHRAPLTSLATSVNWLYSAFPDIYLFGSVLMADSRLIDDEQLAIVDAGYSRAMEELNDMVRLMHMGSYQVRPNGAVV